jgi:hypothetical protein
MKAVFVLLGFFVAAAYAGVGVLTPEIEAEALRLWQAYCDGASEGGTDGNTLIYCKRSGEKIEETKQHELQLTPAADAKEQVVFVQPPSYHYKHDVIVSGGGGAAPKTVIYVKPAKNTHEVNVNDQTDQSVTPQKPTLFFLKGDHGGEAAATDAGARTRRDDVAANASEDLTAAPAYHQETVEVAPPAPKKSPVVYILRMDRRKH